MPTPPKADLCVIGAGIVGLATARALLGRHPHLSLVVLEAEDRAGAHQTGNNSGVLHSGLYYRPGSLKARLCSEGRAQLVTYCTEKAIPFEACGKLVVAASPGQVAALDDLALRGQANGLQQIERLGPQGLREHEPHVRGLEGLWVGDTGIVDFSAVVNHLIIDLRAAGAEIELARPAGAIRRASSGYVIETPAGEVHCRWLVNCAGVQADRVAGRAGVNPGLRMVPFRGEYKLLTPQAEPLVRGLIYPVPDPRFPFLGVHFTRRIQGGIEAGPNAVLAFHRNGYRARDVSAKDLWDLASYPGFWRMAGKYWRAGLGEMVRSFSPAAFTRALQDLIPDIEVTDLVPGGSGVRAQALDPNGTLADDFRIVAGPDALHVLSAPSPAATACLSIGEHLEQNATEAFGLRSRRPRP